MGAMPKTEAEWAEVKARLSAEAAAKFPADPDRRRIYVFGTMRKMGWKPDREK